MSIRPSSRPTSFIMARTLASSVTSQRKANALTPCADRSTTVSRASRDECRNVMATSAPARANRSADARPNRLAAPVTRAVLPFRTLASVSCIGGFYCLPRFGTNFGLTIRPAFVSGYFAFFRATILPAMSELRNVVVYSRKGCHLCEVVKESLSKLSRRGGFIWQEIDVDTDNELRRQFNDEVPVVFIDGRKAFKYRMDEKEFLRKLAN